MKKISFHNKHWPLGELGYAGEIDNLFPEEAKFIGIITILWNIHEANLSRLFCDLLGAKSNDLARAIIDKQPTHKARRDLLALAKTHTKLTKRRSELLDFILKETKRIADRRNILVHGKYVVSFQNDDLYIEQNSPNASKAKKPQRSGLRELRKLTNELETLMLVTEELLMDLHKRRLTHLKKVFSERKSSKSKSS